MGIYVPLRGKRGAALPALERYAKVSWVRGFLTGRLVLCESLFSEKHVLLGAKLSPLSNIMMTVWSDVRHYMRTSQITNLWQIFPHQHLYIVLVSSCVLLVWLGWNTRLERFSLLSRFTRVTSRSGGAPPSVVAVEFIGRFLSASFSRSTEMKLYYRYITTNLLN